jgi:hypothetical protein
MPVSQFLPIWPKSPGGKLVICCCKGDRQQLPI